MSIPNRVKSAAPDGRRIWHIASGAAATQVIPIAVAPLLTRLYAPTDYAALATFGALAAIVSAIATGRYHMATLLPSSAGDALQITRLSLRLATWVALVLTVAVALGYSLFHEVDALASVGWFLLLVPLTGALIAVNDTLAMSMLRMDHTRRIAESSLTRAVGSASTQVAMGFARAPFGLIWGSLLGSALGNYRMWRVYRSERRALSGDEHRRMLTLMRRYSNFPKYELWAFLANSLSVNVITLGIGVLYAQHFLGQYALALRVLVLPSAVIGSAIGQVYMRNIAQTTSDRSANAFRRTCFLLSGLAVPGLLVLLLFGQPIFALVFGEEWREAGRVATVLAPMVAVRFVVSPLSTVFLVYERQRLLLGFQVGLLAAAGAVLLLAQGLSWSAIDTIVFLGVSNTVIYAALGWTSWRVVRSGRRPESDHLDTSGHQA